MAATPQLAKIINALTDHGCHPKKQGREFKCKCPAHEDKVASLQVGDGDKGVVLHCHAGCRTDDVLKELGVDQQDLWYEGPKRPDGSESRPAPGSGLNTVQQFNYEDERGDVLFRVERKQGKKFVQSKPDGKGGWEYTTQGVQKVPYHLRQLRAGIESNKLVFVVEGEKDVHKAESHGLVATCNPGGAGKWAERYSEWFANAHVVVLPDNDEPGIKHAEAVAKSLVANARSVRILRLQGVPEKGDLSDWFENGGTPEQLKRLARSVEPLEGSGPQTFSAYDLMREEFEEPRMAIPGIIAEGATFLVGSPKIGKSWFGLNLALSVATGDPCLQHIAVEQGEALVLALEDTPRRLQHRIRMMQGGDDAPKGLHLATKWPRMNTGGLQLLEVWLQEHPDARLIIIDTWAKVRSADPGSESMYQADYSAVSAVKALADQYRCAIALVHHQRKATDSDPLNTVAGSTGLTGAADAAVILSRHRGSSDGHLYVTGRDVEESKSVVSFDGATGLWVYLGEAEEVEEMRTQDAVKQLLALSDEAMGPKEVADALDIKEGTSKWLLSKMAQEGAIKKLGRGKYVALDSDKQQMVGGGAPSSANQPTSPLITQPGLEDAAGPTDEDIEDALNQWGDGTGDGDDNQGGKTDGN
jgi:hypothetical protein